MIGGMRPASTGSRIGSFGCGSGASTAHRCTLVDTQPARLWDTPAARFAALHICAALGHALPGVWHDHFVELPAAWAVGRCLAFQCRRDDSGRDCSGLHTSLLLLPCARHLESAWMAFFQFGLEPVGCPVGSLWAVVQPLDLNATRVAIM